MSDPEDNPPGPSNNTEPELDRTIDLNVRVPALDSPGVSDMQEDDLATTQSITQNMVLAQLCHNLQQLTSIIEKISTNQFNRPELFTPKIEFSSFFSEVPQLNIQDVESIVRFVVSIDDLITLEQGRVLKFLVTKVHAHSRQRWCSSIAQYVSWSDVKKELLKLIPVTKQQQLIDQFVRQVQGEEESFFCADAVGACDRHSKHYTFACQ